MQTEALQGLGEEEPKASGTCNMLKAENTQLEYVYFWRNDDSITIV